MDLGKYKKAMRPKKYLDGNFVVYDPTLPDPSDVQLETRDTFAIGGGIIEGEDYGTREGFVRPKVSSQKMTVNQALQEIFQTQTEFLNRDELKTLVDKKTGLNISKNVLKPSKYPILKKVKYRTSELMKEKTKQNKASGLSKEQRFEKAQTKKQQRINLFKEKLGLDIEIGSKNELLGLDEDLKKKLNNASKSFRDKKLSTKGLETFNDPNFFDFFNTEYQTADDRIEAIAKSYGYNLDEWNTLSTEQKKRIYNEEFNNKMRIKRGEVPSGLSIEEIVEQAYQGKKLPGGGPAAKTLDTVYETLFRQEYDKLAEKGDPFSKADLSKNVEARLREMFGRPGQEFPEKLLPGRTPYTDTNAKNYTQYIDPRTQGGSKKNKIFSDYELELFDGMTAASLNKTKTQEKLFDIIAKGPVEIDELSQKLDMTPNRIRSEINKLLTNAIIRSDKPAFLKGKKDLFSNLINNLEASKTLDNDWNRSLKYSIYSEINDSVLQKAAFNRIDEFDSMLKIIQEKFPGVQVQYDHPAGYTALKNQNFKNFLNVTPIAADINRLKSTFDSKSNQNLLAMNDAKTAGNQQLYDDLLNKQIKLENTWSKLTGGSSSLGKIRLEGVEDFGTTSLTESSKDLFGEFKNNISIRENIAKNLSDDIKKDIIDVLPRKDRETSVIKTLESITNPDLIKQDKAVSQFVKKLEQKLQENPGMVESLKKGGFKCRREVGGKVDLE